MFEVPFEIDARASKPLNEARFAGFQVVQCLLQHQELLLLSGYPQAPPDTFKQFLLYVYTGKILLQDSGVFEMMALAQELGVDELRNACEDHVTSTLSVPSACTFLSASMDIQDRSPGLIDKLPLNRRYSKKSNGIVSYDDDALGSRL
ncbi:hypothetical protein NQ317_016293 [Molorchus minor]|uniref:BTB domain-containing protein n=1 Tax=Molorchus minor TaxID=1323400 RepID=A0ABQ9ITS7_9CUCU|nr:hypothetical protein NQ317_016293 [Molorchus minor]